MMLQHSSGLNSTFVNNSNGLVNSMQNLGLYHLLDFYLRGFASKFPTSVTELSESQLQTAWHCCKWELDPKESQILESGREEDSMNFHMGAYVTLRALHEGDERTFWSTLRQARLEQVKNIGLISIESTKSVSPALVKLQFFNEIEGAWKLRWKSSTQKASIPGKQQVEQLQHQWKERSFLMENNFELFEPILALRGVLLRTLERAEHLPQHYLTLSKLARKANRFQIASNAIYQIKQTTTNNNSNNSSVIDLSWRLEESKILWDQGEQKKAVTAAKSLIVALTQTKQHQQQKLYGDTLYYTGKWLAETRAESANTTKEYLRDAVQLYSKIKPDNVSKAFFTLANYTGMYGSST